MENMITMKVAHEMAKAEREIQMEVARLIICKGIQTAALNGKFKYYVPKRAVKNLSKEEVGNLRLWLTSYGFTYDQPEYDNTFTVYWD